MPINTFSRRLLHAIVFPNMECLIFASSNCVLRHFCDSNEFVLCKYKYCPYKLINHSSSSQVSLTKSTAFFIQGYLITYNTDIVRLVTVWYSFIAKVRRARGGVRSGLATPTNRRFYCNGTKSPQNIVANLKFPLRNRNFVLKLRFYTGNFIFSRLNVI